jgi:WD40 repeat protein/tetratricopeptide (TPR) repeat protein
LQDLVQIAIQLHEKLGNPVLLARDYGFLAQVALHEQEWDPAQELAEKALEILATDPQQEHQHQGLYLLLLARILRQLGETGEAIHRLEEAAKGDPEDNPQLYIEILEELRSLYYEQLQYANAFNRKQQRLSIEQQFGLRAFIGAGRLESQRQARSQPTPTESQGSVAREILASGRQKDVERLIQRIGSTQYKLTVIHGPSGVGKSSLVQAGLLPGLKKTIMGDRDILLVSQRLYTDWAKSLGQLLGEALVQRGIQIDASPDAVDRVLEQLRQNELNHLLTVLIFDQFEEFFFVCNEPEKRRKFFEFLGDCFQIPFVKVVLSLREDYIHYLLAYNSQAGFEAIDSDILSKNTLYAVGNFLPADAVDMIRSLSDRAHFPLEPELIQAVVTDLAENLNAVRPIELQIVGAQLQTDNINTLAEYRELGPQPKEQLVRAYLEEVVADCGPQNKELAELILYLLTDENNTRPLKTRTDLETDLKVLVTDVLNEPERVDLVLYVLVNSGLVFLLPECPSDRYQLVHDYVVAFIRQNQGQQVKKELEEERTKRKQSEERLMILQQANQILDEAQKKALRIVRLGLVGFALTSLVAVTFLLGVMQKAEIQALNSDSKERLVSSDRRGALITSIKAGKKLLQINLLPDYLKNQTLQLLENLVFTDLKEGNRLVGHGNGIRRISFSPDGEILASASTDNTIKLWQLDGTVLHNLEGHTDVVTDVSFSPNGQQIASASFDGTIKLWERNGTLQRSIPGEQEVFNSVTFSPNGEIVAATTTWTDRIKLWRTDDGSLLRMLEGHETWVMDSSFSPDGKILVSADYNGWIKLWRVDEGTLIKTFQGHEDRIYRIVFSPDGQKFASASMDKTIKIWNADGTLFKTLVGHDDKVSSLSFSPNGKTLASASNDKSLILWDTESGIMYSTLKAHDGFVWDVSFSPDGKALASASADHTIKLWRIDNAWVQTLIGHTKGVTSVSLNSDSSLIISGSYDKSLRIWDRNGNSIFQVTNAHDKEISSVSFSPNNQIIASASYDNTVKLWKADGTPIKTLIGHKSVVNSLSFSPDGQRIATASHDKTVKVWQQDGSLILNLDTFNGPVYVVTFSPDGQILAASSENMVTLWQLDGTKLATLDRHLQRINSISFSSDSQWIATGSVDKTINIWARDGTFIQTLNTQSGEVHDVIFSPDGQTLASASSNSTISLWRRNAEIGMFETSPYQTLNKHQEGIYDLSFSSDGQILASASEDRTLILWNWQKMESMTLPMLLKLGCEEIQDYLQNNPLVNAEDRHLCSSILKTRQDNR